VGHQTGFIFEVQRLQPSGAGTTAIRPSDGTIPIEHLRVVKWEVDGRID
jgi:hypothetical protein